MALDPLLDVIWLEPEMAAEAIVGDRVAMTARSASIDERLRDAEYVCHCSTLR